MAMQSGQTWQDGRDQSVSRGDRTTKREAESSDQSGAVEEAQSHSGAPLWRDQGGPGIPAVHGERIGGGEDAVVAALHGAEPEKDVSMVEERQVGAGNKSATHH